jgi:uncharacterized protein
MKLYTDKNARLSRNRRVFPFLPLAAVWGWLFVFIPLWSLAQSDASLFPPKPEPAVYVHDYAGWLSADQKFNLERKLRAYWDSTSTQIVVMIRRDIGDYDKASYAFELGNRWGIGRADKDNGVVMLIKTEPPERGIFIATGYGAEGALPDITAGRIIRNNMAPLFREGRYYDGINVGVDNVIAALRGEFKAEDTPEYGDGEALLVVALVFLTVFLLFSFLVYRARRNGTTYTHYGRNERRQDVGRGGLPGGWWWGTGGGWGSSGGGSWGGGGGGGGWGDGGSFGGGDFGGGGAGGDW